MSERTTEELVKELRLLGFTDTDEAASRLETLQSVVDRLCMLPVDKPYLFHDPSAAKGQMESIAARAAAEAGKEGE